MLVMMDAGLSLCIIPVVASCRIIQAVRGSTSLKKTPRRLPSTVAPFSSTYASLQRTETSIYIYRVSCDGNLVGKIRKMIIHMGGYGVLLIGSVGVWLPECGWKMEKTDGVVTWLGIFGLRYFTVPYHPCMVYIYSVPTFGWFLW